MNQVVSDADCLAIIPVYPAAKSKLHLSIIKIQNGVVILTGS